MCCSPWLAGPLTFIKVKSIVVLPLRKAVVETTSLRDRMQAERVVQSGAKRCKAGLKLAAMKGAGQVSKKKDGGTLEPEGTFPLKHVWEGKCGPGTVLNLNPAPKNGQENEDTTLPTSGCLSECHESTCYCNGTCNVVTAG